MNHIGKRDALGSCSIKACHPERSRATSEASRPTESKDPMFFDSATDTAGNFRIAVRFYDDQDAECLARSEPRSGKKNAAHGASRGWKHKGNRQSPEGATEIRTRDE